MNLLATIAIFLLIFGLMAIGLLLTNRPLKKGCSLGPDCHCKSEEDQKSCSR